MLDMETIQSAANRLAARIILFGSYGREFHDALH